LSVLLGLLGYTERECVEGFSRRIETGMVAAWREAVKHGLAVL
jgi:hypothetical protein